MIVHLLVSTFQCFYLQYFCWSTQRYRCEMVSRDSALAPLYAVVCWLKCTGNLSRRL